MVRVYKRVKLFTWIVCLDECILFLTASLVFTALSKQDTFRLIETVGNFCTQSDQSFVV